MLQVTGLCRFSYPTGGHSGFSRPAELYAPDRLARRLQYFETVCLPPLRRQTDANFSLLVLTGENLPAAARARLTDLLADLPQAKLFVEPEGQRHVPLCNRLLLEHRDPASEAAVEFCMDDDDAVAVDFVQKLRRRARQARALWSTGIVVEIDFVKGLVLQAGLVPALRTVTVAHWASAQAFVVRRGIAHTAFNRNHFLHWKRSVCLSLADPAMFVRSLHGENDSSNTAEDIASLADTAQPADIDSLLRTRFGIDPGALASLPAVWTGAGDLTEA